MTADTCSRPVYLACQTRRKNRLVREVDIPREISGLELQEIRIYRNIPESALAENAVARVACIRTDQNRHCEIIRISIDIVKPHIIRNSRGIFEIERVYACVDPKEVRVAVEIAID